MDVFLKAFLIEMFTVLFVIVGTVSQFLPSSVYQNPQLPGAIQQPIGSPMMMPSPIQMPLGYPQQRLPVMVMPFHSKAADKKYMKHKRRKPRKYYTDSESTSTSDSESCSSSNEYSRMPKHRSGHRKKKRQVLTPVISYITRNGRVVYQKKIKKENAGDWLEIGKKKIPSRLVEEGEAASGEMTIRDLKHKYGLNHNHHNHDD